MSNINLGGVSSGGSRPSLWAARQRLKDIILSSVAGATLDLRFTSKSYYRFNRNSTDKNYVGDYAPGIEFLGENSRTSGATYPEWDFVSGSEVGRLEKYPDNELRSGAYGVLREGAGTNHIRNPRCEGAVAGAFGSGGQPPTGWWITQHGTTATIIDSGTEDGWPYVDVQFSGTPTGNPYVSFAGGGVIAALNGETWSLSIGARLAGGSNANVSGVKVTGFVYAPGPSYLSSLYSGPTVAVDGTHKRLTETATISDATAATLQPVISLMWDGSGDIDITLRIYAPQLEQASAPSSPILPPKDTPGTSTRAPDVGSGVTVDRDTRGWASSKWDYTHGGEAGVLEEFLPDVPRITAQGLHVAEGTTNEITNPRFEGATPGVIGSGGALPTGYLSALGSATLEVIGTGTENGWPYLELEYTAAGAVFPQIYGSAATASAGQTWTSSWGVKVISSTGGFLGHNFKMREFNGGTITNDTLSSGYQEEPSVHSRGVFTATLTGGATTSARGGLLFGFNAAGSVRVRLYAPQLEQKAYATDVVLPPEGEPAASTRDAEVISVDPATWLNAAACSLFIDGKYGGFSGTGVIGGLGDTFDNTVYVSATVGGVLGVPVRSGGASQASLNPPGASVVVGETFRVATALAKDDMASIATGATLATDTTAEMPASNARLKIGSAPWTAGSGSHFNGVIERVSVKPYRVPDAELEAYVA